MILLTDILQSIVDGLQPDYLGDNPPSKVYFDYGHYVEVTRNLDEKEAGIATKFEKYPLVWLVMDFRERVSSSYSYEVPNVHIIIAQETRGTEWKTKDRIEHVFKPILIPIYEALMKALMSAHYLSSVDVLNHDRILRPFWGTSSASQELIDKNNIFNDNVDVIEISNLPLTVNNIC